MELHIRNDNGTWLFDDEQRNVFNEPFVEGSSEIISAIQHLKGINSNNLTLTFSEKPFTHSSVLVWIDSRGEGSWNLYYNKELDLFGWLCPVLLKYFKTPPEVLYVDVNVGIEG